MSTLLRGFLIGVCRERLRRDCCGNCCRRFSLAAAGAKRSADGGQEMNGPEIVGLVLSVGLLVYLTIALLKPEWFA